LARGGGGGVSGSGMASTQSLARTKFIVGPKRLS
jgi:hypothetical protein